jgi:hypothetical protein
MQPATKQTEQEINKMTGNETCGMTHLILSGVEPDSSHEVGDLRQRHAVSTHAWGHRVLTLAANLRKNEQILDLLVGSSLSTTIQQLYKRI